MRTLEVQEEVQNRIKEYLARPWIDRFRTKALQYLANLLGWGRRNQDDT
jgi:hypothetical protein